MLFTSCLSTLLYRPQWLMERRWDGPISARFSHPHRGQDVGHLPDRGPKLKGVLLVPLALHNNQGHCSSENTQRFINGLKPLPWSVPCYNSQRVQIETTESSSDWCLSKLHPIYWSCHRWTRELEAKSNPAVSLLIPQKTPSNGLYLILSSSVHQHFHCSHPLRLSVCS